MCNSLRQNICNSSKLNLEIDNLPAHIEQNISRELQYSCFHWSSHVSRSFSVGNTLTKSLNSFCFQHLLHWIEVLSLFGELSLAIPALTSTQEWCENAGMDSNMLTILGDAEWFVLGFFEPISQSAQHVYYSTLPFTPRATLLALNYADDLQSTARVKGSVEENWNPYLQGSDRTICIALSPDNSYVACGLKNGNVEVWSVVTGLWSVSIECHLASVSSITFSSDSKWIASRSGQEIQIWDATEALLLLTFTSK
ncbi:hypothetical protein L208DRAFT_1503359 [Tricholoma matsutake]|nr:hypothetical protein L208DRAFT_1503359 [Tricholoma matsutake 945]